ncbi:MAG: undecaprenyl/decaprenyl-phosphate alpha-N-acetylglucosaminyl 1-phosphate transferase [Proteobacteria bacterium]|nr:undecaprenyl/decaprenyl-phosphate alpha-N-acetylglucosaminyl 1-phosphate transferase [Pseudomonadota bacterium]MBU1595306.1 undecaprenyl/decaprenyl-phosphate alpha-N-acetylglucosaminyl 1-phosphate transferase [Pseudomonadota bacterium]
MTPLLLLVLALILSVTVSTVLVRASSHAKNGFMDKPDERKVHDHPIPRTGGIAVFVGALAAMSTQLDRGELLLGFAAGASVLVIFGMIDDYRGLDFRIKFLGQVLACATLLLVSGLGIRTLGQLWPGVTVDLGVLWPLFTTFFLLTAINAVNFSDGLDGLAGGISLLILSCVALMALFVDNTSVLIISLCAVGGLIGFLRLNVHPAVIFMGDTGSQFLGYTLGVCLIALTQQGSIYSPILPLFLLGTPLLDLIMVIFQRLLKKQSIFRPDTNHLHHKLLLNGLDHAQSVTLIHLGNLAMLALGFSLRFARDYVLAGIYLGLVAALLGTIYVIKKSNRVRIGIQNMLRRGFGALVAGATPIYSPPALAHASWLFFMAAFAAVILVIPFLPSELDKTQGVGFFAAAAAGAILYRAQPRWFDHFIRLAAYFIMLYGVILHANSAFPDSLVSQTARFLFIILGVAYSGYLVLSREQLLLDGMDILLIAIAVFALFTPSTGSYAMAQLVLSKTLLGGLCINLLMNKLSTYRKPLALLCLATYLAIFARSMI